MTDLDKRIKGAMSMAIRQRNYRRARDRAMTRLSNAYPETYKELLEQEKIVDEQMGKKWLDIDGSNDQYIWILTPAHHLRVEEKATKPVPVQTKATMEEKRENKRITRQYSKALGYTDKQTTCLITLWTRESRFDHLADNPRSTAYGIAQLLRERSREPELQILHGIRYIGHRYRGDACSALRHSDRRGWY